MTLTPTLVRHAVGLAALVVVAAGLWGLFGWPVAAIAIGAPFLAFYLWGEAQLARTGPDPRGEP